MATQYMYMLLDCNVHVLYMHITTVYMYIPWNYTMYMYMCIMCTSTCLHTFVNQLLTCAAVNTCMHFNMS